MTKETVLDCDFLILNRIAELYSARRFQSEITRLNCKAQLVTPEWLIENASQFETRGPGLGILYRQGDFNFWPTQTALMKLPFNTINKPAAFLKARDKWLTIQEWQKHEIPMPRTCLLTDFIARSTTLNTSAIFQSVQEKFQLPLMLKKRFSSQGHGVFLINDEASLSSVLKHDANLFMDATTLERDYFNSEFKPISSQVSTFMSSVAPSIWIQLRRWIVQECIQDSLGYDVRVFSVQERNHPIERHNKHSFRSNLHQGGAASPTVLTTEEIKLCESIHSRSGLHYSGIDFLRSRSGPLFLEINPSPGFEGIDQAYSNNIAASLISLF